MFLSIQLRRLISLSASQSIVFEVEFYYLCIKAKILASNRKVFPHIIYHEHEMLCEMKGV